MHLLANFKSFADAQLNLFQPATLLIGPNGSGKSNLIEGVELLAHVARGTPLYEIADIGKSSGDGMEVRGGLGECPRYGTDTFMLGFRAAVPFEKRKRPFEYQVSIKVEPAPHINDESLWLADEGTLIFETLGHPEKTGEGVSDVRFNNCKNLVKVLHFIQQTAPEGRKQIAPGKRSAARGTMTISSIKPRRGGRRTFTKQLHLKNSSAASSPCR